MGPIIKYTLNELENLNCEIYTADWSVVALDAWCLTPDPMRPGKAGNTVEGVEAVSVKFFHRPRAACVCRTMRACAARIQQSYPQDLQKLAQDQEHVKRSVLQHDGAHPEFPPHLARAGPCTKELSYHHP